jgi:UPF0755 protein
MKNISCVILLLLAGALAVTLYFFHQAYLGSPVAGGTVPVVISASTEQAAAQALTEAHVIRSAWWYRVYARIDAAARRPKLGTYDVRPGTSLREIARHLALGPKRSEVSITIIEGWTVDEISAKVSDVAGIQPETTRRAIGYIERNSRF